MNEKLLKRGQKDVVFLSTFLGLLAASASAQSGVAFFGNTHIGPETEVHVKTYAVQLNGIATTQRGATAGILSLSNDASIGTASGTGYVNGFVRSYGNTATLFPVGSSTVYAPITITPATQQAVDVAYNSAAFNATSFDATVLTEVSATEYWDVLGNNSGLVTLTWQAGSALNALATNVDLITIAGWNGTSWVPVAGSLSDGATLSRGSLTTTAAADFTVYSAFTFAALADDTAATNAAVAKQTFMFLNNGNFGLSSLQDVASVSIYDLTGKQVQTYIVKGTAYTSAFTHAKGVYIAKAQLTNGETVTRKLLNQ